MLRRGEKQDLIRLIVAVRPANKGREPLRESEEPRAGLAGNLRGLDMGRTPSRVTCGSKKSAAAIRQAVRPGFDDISRRDRTLPVRAGHPGPGPRDPHRHTGNCGNEPVQRVARNRPAFRLVFDLLVRDPLLLPAPAPPRPLRRTPRRRARCAEQPHSLSLQPRIQPESTDRSLRGRAAGLAESSAGVAALAGRCRGRTGARSRRSTPLGGAEGAGARVREACAGMLARASEPAGAVSGRQAGSGSARNRASAAAHWPAQGQRFGRCRVQRRAEWVSRPARAK